jgi:hypothetical protein
MGRQWLCGFIEQIGELDEVRLYGLVVVVVIQGTLRRELQADGGVSVHLHLFCGL